MTLKSWIKDVLAKFWIVAPLPTTTYTTRYLDPFVAGNWDFSIQTPILISVYGDTFGGAAGNTVVTGSWFVTIIVLYWLRHDDIAIPMVMTAILGNVAFWSVGIVPEEWKWFIAITCLLIPVASILYAYWTDR